MSHTLHVSFATLEGFGYAVNRDPPRTPVRSHRRTASLGYHPAG